MAQKKVMALCHIRVHYMSPHLYRTKQCSISVWLSFQNCIKYHSNNRLAAGQFSFIFHHYSILHCISLAAETMHLDLHTLINMAFPAGKGQHQLTFPSYHSASASNNNIASQQELITLQWHLCKIAAMKIFADKKSSKRWMCRPGRLQ